MLKHGYLISDIHVCPSHYEPFGLVAAEAMAAGRAVVVSATGGLRDIVGKPSVGCVFSPGDVDGLAASLSKLAHDAALRKRLGRNAAQHVREHFAWPKIAELAAACYEEAIKSHRKAGAA